MVQFKQKRFIQDVRHFVGDGSLRAAEEVCGVDHAVIWRILRGQNPSMEDFVKLCTVMEVRTEEYFDELWMDN